MAANNVRRYQMVPGKSVQGLVYAVENALYEKNMDVQRIGGTGNSEILQARVKGGRVKQLVGLDKALTVRMSWDENGIQMETGEGKWVDKGVTMAVSMFVLWPLAITSGAGIYQQMKLNDNIWKAADAYMYA